MGDVKQGLGAAFSGWADGFDKTESDRPVRRMGSRSPPRPLYSGRRVDSTAQPAMAILAAIGRAIETDIIPLLLQARHDAEVKMNAADSPTMAEEVVEFAELVLAGDEIGALKSIDRLRAAGVTVETLFLELFTGTARRLGEFWTADRCNFVQVTLGMMMLQRLVHDLEFDFQAEAPPVSRGELSLLLPLPGEQHNFGLSLVTQYFRRDGWEVFNDQIESSAALVEAVRGQEFTMLGLSASCDVHMEALASRIAMVRRASRNKSIIIMVGGNVFNENPALVTRVGADLTAPDARSAVLAARSIVDRRIRKDS